MPVSLGVGKKKGAKKKTDHVESSEKKRKKGFFGC